MKLSAVDKVYNAIIVNGERLTSKQIAARYKVANPHDTVYTLRMEGFPISCTRHVDTKGRISFKYELNDDPRELIAAGYKAMAAGLV